MKGQMPFLDGRILRGKHTIQIFFGVMRICLAGLRQSVLKGTG